MGRVARGLVIVAALLLVACTDDPSTPGATPPQPVPGVTENEIVVGTHQPLTGPTAADYANIATATRAYFDYVNANGGVHGRKITYKIVDDAGNPTATQTAVRQLVEQDKVFAILNGLGTPTHSEVIEFLTATKVPDLFVGSGSRTWNQPAKYPGIFGYQPDHTTEGKILAAYVKAALPDKKVCFFGQDDDFGRDSLLGIEQILGAPVVAKQTYPPSDTNVAAQIGALKAAGCEVVMLATVPAFTARAVGAAAAVSFKPQFVSSGVGGDSRAVATAPGAARSLPDGFISAGYLPAVAETANPWNVLFKKINKDYNNDAPYDASTVYGMSVGYVFVQALQAAGRDLTREGIVAAVEKGFVGGPGIAPLTYAKDNHAGYTGVRLLRVTNSVQGYFGPVYQTDPGNGPVTEYTTPPAAPPEKGIPTPP